MLGAGIAMDSRFQLLNFSNVNSELMDGWSESVFTSTSFLRS